MSLEKFRNYLISKGLVLGNQLPYYIQREDGYLQFSNAKNHASDAQMLEPFLKTLGKNRKQLQVDRAKEDISFYHFFLTAAIETLGQSRDHGMCHRGPPLTLSKYYHESRADPIANAEELKPLLPLFSASVSNLVQKVLNG